MMNKSNPFRHLAVAGILCLLAASCSDEGDSGDRLPDGTYPMTFTAAVDELTVSRATTDNSWANGENVAIRIGSEVKKYKAANDGSLTIAENGTPFYWQTTSDITVNAWYPYSTTKPTAAELRVKANQSENNNYLESDYLEAVDATVTFNTPAALTFKHRTAKVVVSLKTGEGVTDLTGAAVTFVNQTGVEDNGTEVTPKTETTNGMTTYTALLIPQQMQGKKFIKVTVGTNTAACDYYYTPTGSTDANLEAGKQYTYTITVKKTGLEVQVTDNGAAWGSGTDITGSTPSTIEHHVITITNNSSLNDLVVKDAGGTTITAQPDGTYQLPATATTFSVSYSPSDKTKSLVPTSGLCRLSSRSANTDNGLKYICNYSSVISDVTLDLDKYVQAGDYYYSDGTWTPETPSASNGGFPTAIGVVFYVGAGPDDDISHYGGSGLTGKIHGYAVAAKDLLGGSKTSYGGKLPKVNSQLQDYDVPEIANNNKSSYNGYSVTKIIKKSYISLSTTYEFPAFAACATYHSSVQAAPNNSSGWYLPSVAMLGAINGIKSSLQNCPGGSVPNRDYMSCSESDAEAVQGYAFHQNKYTGRTKNDNNTYARAVLTF